MCPTAGLTISCDRAGEEPYCFIATPTTELVDGTSTIEYSYDLLNWLPYTNPACIPVCNSYPVYINEGEGNDVLIGATYTGIYFGGTGDNEAEIIASSTYYEFEVPYTVVDAAGLSAVVNALGLPGFFVVEDNTPEMVHFSFIGNCGTNPGTAQFLVGEGLSAGLLYLDDLTCQFLESLPEFTCADNVIYFRHTVVSSEPCCAEAVATYMVSNIEGCGCFNVTHIEEEATIVTNEDCTTTTTTTIRQPSVVVEIQVLKQTTPFNVYEATIVFTGDTPTHARLTTSSSGYDTGWQVWNANLPMPTFDPTTLVNNETIYLHVSFDGGTTIAASDTVLVLKDTVNVLQSTNNLYNITAHPNFVQCQFSTPFILAEYKTNNLISTFAPNGSIGLDYTTGATPGATALGCCFSCLDQPPPIVKYYVVVIINVLP